MTVAAEELRAFVERYERLEAEKADIAEGQKEVLAEARRQGYCTKGLRRIINLRKMDANALAEAEAIEELYRAALGM